MKIEIDPRDVILLKAIREVLDNTGYGETYGYLGRIEAIIRNLRSTVVLEKEKKDSEIEFNNILKQTKDYKRGCLVMRLDNLIKKLETQDQSWFNYYLKKDDLE